MKKNQLNLLILLTVSIISFSCYKETGDDIDNQEKYYLLNKEATAQVKFVHAYTPLTINGLTAGTTTAGVGFRINMDGNKINGATNTSGFTNTLVYGGVYPPTTAYSFLPPGQRNFKMTMNRIVSGAYAPTTADDVFNSTVNLVAGKRYSMFLADPYPTPSIYMLEDNYSKPNGNFYAIRFINLCGDLTSRFDVYSMREGQVLFSNVGNKEVKNFVFYPIRSKADTILLRNAGTTTTIAQVNGFSPGPEKVYTFYARGKTGVTGRTPGITFYTNR